MLGEQRRIVLAGLAATEERGSILRLHDGLTANGRGISGGGPHVLACVALLPERVVAAASLASLAAYDGEVLDSFDGMGEGSTQDSKLYVEHGREAGRADAEQQAEAQGDAAVPEPVAMMSAFHRRRREGAHGGPGDFLLSGTQHGLSPGTEVWLDEDMVRPRGLDPDDVRVPVRLRQAVAMPSRVPRADGVAGPDEALPIKGMPTTVLAASGKSAAAADEKLPCPGLPEAAGRLRP